jgi:hypothetical protein
MFVFRIIGGLAALALCTTAGASAVVHLEQNWSAQLREQFYFTPQGSHVVPYDWFLALERSGDEVLFSSPENLARFGWLYHDSASPQLNPGGLPIGMTREPATAPGGGNWMGITCAACHSSNVLHEGKVVRIDGAPSMLDFGAFLGALSSAVLANHPTVDAEKFKRFAERVPTARRQSNSHRCTKRSPRSSSGVRGCARRRCRPVRDASMP